MPHYVKVLSSIIICEFLDDFSNVFNVYNLGGKMFEILGKGEILDLGVVKN